MGMWDWLEQQYPAPGSRAEKNGFPPLSASDAALLRLIERGVAAGAQDDDASAAQAARETGAAAVARAVKPPYGRDKGWLTQMPEDWLQSISPLLKGRYQAWPSPSHPVSPMSAPASPSLPGGSATTDEPSEAQAARDAGAAILARAARHPYGRRLFASAVVPSASTDTEDMRESQIMRETAAQAARESAALKRPTLRAPRTVGRKAR